LCLSADLSGPQPPPVIIFKGAGHISEVEKLSYNPGVHVMFQKKAWLDRVVCSSWVSDVWSPFVKANFDEHEGCLLTCDSVDPQRLRSFEKSLKEARTTHHLGEPKFTHVWQMIDRHVGKTWKDLYFELQIEHLSVDAEWEKFISLKAWERRVLMTHWVGLAYRLRSGQGLNLRIVFPSFQRGPPAKQMDCVRRFRKLTVRLPMVLGPVRSGQDQ